MANQKTILSRVRQKNALKTFDPAVNIGVTFDQVIDSTSTYSLKQFFENYLQFMTTSYFMYIGSETPVNAQTLIWIDTSSSPATD